MKTVDELKVVAQKVKHNVDMRVSKKGYRVLVGMGTCGIAAGARPIMMNFVEEVAKNELDDVTVTQMGCVEKCDLEPIVKVVDTKGNETLYGNVTEDKVAQIIEKHVINGQVIEEYKI